MADNRPRVPPETRSAQKGQRSDSRTRHGFHSLSVKPRFSRAWTCQKAKPVSRSSDLLGATHEGIRGCEILSRPRLLGISGATSFSASSRPSRSCSTSKDWAPRAWATAAHLPGPSELAGAFPRSPGQREPRNTHRDAEPVPFVSFEPRSVCTQQPASAPG